jgi:DnaJ-class molecular chaperone
MQADSSATDPYKILGVSRTAAADEIHAAFRKLAKKHHPDLNPGNAAAEQKFKAAAAAHDLLTDAEKRAQFDRGEINAEGQPNERQFYRQYAEGAQGARYRRAAPEGGGFDDIFADLFRQAQAQGGNGGGGRAGGGGAGGMKLRGENLDASLTIPFLEAALGGTRQLVLPDGDKVEITIPPGVDDGQVLRMRGKGHAGWNGGPPGDALIEISVVPHAFFRREGNDIHFDLPVTVAEAALGGRVTVPTLTGPVSMAVPPHSDAGKVLRLKGKGIPAHGNRPAGDLYATLKLVIGKMDDALEQALRDWAARHDIDPRAGLVR